MDLAEAAHWPAGAGPVRGPNSPPPRCLRPVIAPARVWLTPSSSPQPAPSPASACLQLPTAWIARLRTGERVKFADARNSKRSFKIVWMVGSLLSC